MYITLIVVLAIVLSGCDNKAQVSSIPDGSTTISKSMRGIWKAPGGDSCRWWIVTKDKKRITNNGNLKKKEPYKYQSQVAIISSADVGKLFKSDNCAPKGWKP